MGARPRKATDGEVFEAVMRAIARAGPVRVTLAQIAEEAGVTAGALVQRFGSKKELLLAFLAQGSEETDDFFGRLRAGGATPLEALREYAVNFARMGETPGTLAHHLGWLQLDLTDPDFQRLARDHAEAADAAIRDQLADAVAVGELAPETDVETLARLVAAVLGGSLLGWAFRQEGPAGDWVARDLDAALAPHRAAGGNEGFGEPPG